MTENEKCAREAVRKAKKLFNVLLTKEGNHQFFRAHLEPQDIRFVVEVAAVGDPDALDILRQYARGARSAGMKVPDELHAFVWECFIDGLPKRAPGPSPKDTAFRTPFFRACVNLVHNDYGFAVYRNPEHRNSKEPPFSACAIVAQEFGLGESTIEDMLSRSPR
jgi:hypothetical protein